jgi:hypothetical protein
MVPIYQFMEKCHPGMRSRPNSAPIPRGQWMNGRGKTPPSDTPFQMPKCWPLSCGRGVVSHGAGPGPRCNVGSAAEDDQDADAGELMRQKG